MAQSDPRYELRDRREVRLDPAPEGPISPGLQHELIDFITLARFLRRYWLALLGCGLLGAVACYAVSYLFPRIYRAEVLVVPASFEQSPPSLSSLTGRVSELATLGGLDLGGGDRSTDVFLALLQSRHFIEDFISEQHLLPVLFARRWDQTAARWNLRPGETPPSLADGYELFTHDVMSLIEDKKTGLITVRVEWRTPQQAADWANALIARVNSISRALAMRDATQNIEYLNSELRNSEAVELRQSIYSLLQMQMNKRMLASTRPEFAFRVIDPAQSPELRKSVKPRRIVFAVIGLLLGGLVGLAVAFKLSNRRMARAGTTAA